MAKKVEGIIKLQVPAGNATPAPPIGPALGQKGVNIMDFCKQFNAKTADQPGMIIPVVITVYADRSFTFITKTPPAAVLLKKAADIKSGSGEPNNKKVATITTEQAKEIAKAKFDETIEVHIKLGVDGRHADQQVRGAIVLPHGTGKTNKVLVFAKGAKALEAEAAGADYVGGEELAKKIQTENWFDFDVVVATPDMMGVVGRLGKILGPKGLMPNPKSGTVTMDVVRALEEIKAGKVEYRLDKTNIIHTGIGKVSFGPEKLVENFKTLMDAVAKAKPAAAKGQYLRSITIAATMGPGVKVNQAKL